MIAAGKRRAPLCRLHLQISKNEKDNNYTGTCLRSKCTFLCVCISSQTALLAVALPRWRRNEAGRAKPLLKWPAILEEERAKKAIVKHFGAAEKKKMRKKQ